MCCGNQIGAGVRVSGTMRYWDIDTTSYSLRPEPYNPKLLTPKP